MSSRPERVTKKWGQFSLECGKNLNSAGAIDEDGGREREKHCDGYRAEMIRVRVTVRMTMRGRKGSETDTEIDRSCEQHEGGERGMHMKLS